MWRRALVLLTAAGGGAGAQCVMCGRTAAAQNAQRIQVLNHGIIILLLPPLAILTFFLALAWRRRGA